MSAEEISRQEPENPDTIPQREIPMTKDPKVPGKKTGSEWLGILYMIVGLFILIAAFQLYFTIQDLIRTWISDQFVPVVSAMYYLAVIVVGVWLLRDYIRYQ
jgi:hypothetical protein